MNSQKEKQERERGITITTRGYTGWMNGSFHFNRLTKALMVKFPTIVTKLTHCLNN